MKRPTLHHRVNTSFVYVPSHSTDIAKTFARVRKEQAAAVESAKSSKVKPIRKAKP